MKKNTLLIFIFALLFSSSLLAAQTVKISGKYVIDRIITNDGDVKSQDIDITQLGECPYFYNFFESGKLKLTGYDNDDCTEELSENGTYTILDKVLTINFEGKMESFRIESNSENILVLSFIEEESRGFGAYITIKYQFIYKKVL